MKNYLSLKKLSLFFLFSTLILSSVSAKENLSQFENQVLEATLQLQLSTRLCASDKEAVVILDDYMKKIAADDIQSKLSDEAKIIIDNILVLAKYTCLYNMDMNSEDAKQIILAQYNKIVEWNENHTESLNKWYVVSSGDLINSTMRFLPQAQAIKLGLQEKKDYDALVEKHPEMCIAALNSALWYYFAPGIGGGSQKKAGELFNSAYKNAVSLYEKYYSSIFLSQYYYSSDKKKCAEYLEEAEKAYPGTPYIDFIKMLNEKGYSSLDYSNNKEKIDKKLGL